MTHTIRPASQQDRGAILNLLPQLADFDVPPRRNPRHLWEGDARLAQEILDEPNDRSFCHVSVTPDDVVTGVIIVSMRAELLSGEPSAHLEGIVVDPQLRGQGLGRILLDHAEQEAKMRGALSLTLHVFANNHRARSLYAASDYDSELIRAIKWLD